jgi:hypothetical protein
MSSCAAFVHLSSQEKPTALKEYLYALPTHPKSANLFILQPLCFGLALWLLEIR